MASPKRKSWGELSKRSRDRAAREAAAKYGLTRRQARERYNRGTYSPFSPNPEKRIPQSVRKHPQRYPRYEASADLESLRERAYQNIESALAAESFEYNPFAVLDAVNNRASVDALVKMGNATHDELLRWARAQNPAQARKAVPGWKPDMGWWDDNGKWHNIFWYH